MASIHITVQSYAGKATVKLENKTDNKVIENALCELEKHTSVGCQLLICIIDPDTTNFHFYEFMYERRSPFAPQKWILNNVLWSLTNEETRKNMDGMFRDICYNLWRRYSGL